jgi:hypothetical protein
MATYINKETNEYPLYEGDIRLLYPDMGNEFILPIDFAEVTENALPTITENQTFAETTPTLNADGSYERVYVIRDLTEEELQRNQEQVAFYLGGMQTTPDPNAAPQPEL